MGSAGPAGGARGYSAAYLAIGVLAVVLVLLTLGLKNRQEELRHSDPLKAAIPQGEG